MRVFFIIPLFAILSLLDFSEARSKEKSVAQHYFNFSPTQADEKILFKADSIRHERALNLIIATGNVEIVQGQRILRGDNISYDQKRDLLTASGNVTLLEPSGDVLFADHAELTGKSKEGIIKNIRILLSDNSRMAAVGGRIIQGGNVTELGKAVYSPCNKCVTDDGTPLWRLKAIQVNHNKIEKTVEYKDAFLEFLGIPVFYTPYFTHADHTVKRKSGFLIPSYGSDSSLGFIMKTPYYFDISPDKDLTLTPILTGDEGVVLGADYRQRFSNGILNIKGSGTRGNDAEEQVSSRGHFFSYLDLHLNEIWRLNASSEISTDDTYLRRYKFSDQETLTNQIHIEGFHGNNYTSAKGVLWRGLRQTDEPDKTPLIAPIFDVNFLGDPDVAGGRWTFDTNVMSLTRDQGASSRRLSLRTGWRRPHITTRGDIYNFYSSLQTDVYFVENVEKLGGEEGTMYSGLVGRVYPQLGFDWQLPLARQNGSFTQIMEPVLGFMISPNGSNSDKIPNEDSKETELDENSLFSRNRFSGIDRVEGGQRVYYGLRIGLLGTNSYADGFIGQSFRIRRDNNFVSGSGLNDNFSDLVGKISVETSERFKLNYRFRVDKDDFSSRRNEVSAQAKYAGANFNLDYGFFQKGAGSGEFSDREEISTSLNTLITPAWKFNASTRYDIEKEYTVNYRFGLTYMCDCFTMQLDFSKAFTQDRDVAPTDTFFVRFIFKNLGEIHTTKTKGSSFSKN